MPDRWAHFMNTRPADYLPGWVMSALAPVQQISPEGCHATFGLSDGEQVSGVRCAYSAAHCICPRRSNLFSDETVLAKNRSAFYFASW